MKYEIVDSVLAQMKAGELRDPVSSLMNSRLVEFGRGEAVFEMPLRPEIGNAMGVVQGGVLSMLADVAMAMAATSTVDDDTLQVSQVTTVDLFARFLRAVSASGGVLRAEARVVKTGKQLVWTECDVVSDGKLIAKFTATGVRVGFSASNFQRSASSADINAIPTE